MRVLLAKPCKRGNIAPRSRSGHCLCEACLDFRRQQHRNASAAKSAYKKKWLAANPEKASQYSRKWREANPLKRRQVEQAWRAKNPEKVKEYSAKAGRKWSQNNKAKRLASVRARQLAKRHRTPSWVSKEDFLPFYEEAARLTSETGVRHEVDHIIPLQGPEVSGLHVPWNLQVIPESENRRKGNRCHSAF